MSFFSKINRILYINWVLLRYNIDEIILDTHWFSPLKCCVYLNPYYWRLKNKYTRAERVRMAIEKLGPIFVKAGQILSTRRDLIPDDIAFELAKLQDRVPPFPGEIAQRIIEKALHRSIANTFAEFDKTALASASIAQVHAATLLSGESVVVKVLRPNIDKIIERDVNLLLYLANLANRYWEGARYLKPIELVNEVAQTLYDELDLLREGANASQLRRNFANSTLLYIPKVYWQFSRANILVLERIYGLPIHDLIGLREAGVNLRKLAERGLEIFFTQVFRDSFFHADLHPGNLFVDIKNPESPSFIAVDFGIVGSLNHDDKRYLAENMLAFFKRDYQRVAELHIACGWLPPNTRIDQFEGAIRSVSEPVFELPLREISFGKLLLRLFQVARRFHINIQPQLVLLQKTLLNVESLSRELAPDLDLWEQAAPQIEHWMKREVGFKGFIRRIRSNLPLWSEQLPELPTLIHEVLQETKRAKEHKRFAYKRADRDLVSTKSIKIRYFLGGVVVSLIGWFIFIYGWH